MRPAPPWTLDYADGSANRSELVAASADGEVRFEYDPVTRAQSSTGMYDGGPPRNASLAPDDPRIAEIWRRVLELESAATRHTELRGKGTGAFTVTTGSGTRSFIITMGPWLAELDALLAEFGR